ncbi:MAG: hypothetical protein R3D68_10575 [Hyphomicrobiaceae bacterium]
MRSILRCIVRIIDGIPHCRPPARTRAFACAAAAILLNSLPAVRPADAAGPDRPGAQVVGAGWSATVTARHRRTIVPFRASPFPYAGTVPATGKPFYDIVLEDRSGRSSRRTGGIYWADKTYNDRRVLLDIPAGFDPARPGVIVVFFHGNAATLDRDVVRRQRVPDQTAAAQLNSVLVAPQMAHDAWDSSSGSFWKRGAFAAFMEEAATRLARLAGDGTRARTFRSMPIVLVAYSGGYQPLAFALRDPAIAPRVRGVVLLDALYGELDAFEAWLARSRDGFLVSSFAKTTTERNAQLQRALEQIGRQPRARTQAPSIRARSYLIPAPEAVSHHDFVTKACGPTCL